MKLFKTICAGISLILVSSTSVNAQDFDMATIKSEIKAAALKEQNAFKKGECDKVLGLMEDSITFLANGNRVPSKQIVGKFCNSIPRPFKEAFVDKLDVYPLTNKSGYVIRTLEFPNDEKTKMQEYVTKIWRKTDGEWKISHLHSTVKKVHIKD